MSLAIPITVQKGRHEQAKRAVEIAIEEGQEAGMEFLKPIFPE